MTPKDEDLELEADVHSANEMWENLSNTVKEKEQAFKQSSNKIANKAEQVAKLNQ